MTEAETICLHTHLEDFRKCSVNFVKLLFVSYSEKAKETYTRGGLKSFGGIA
ncbi:hypothetical protein ACI3LX_002232 [Candidozyma auris]